MQGLLQWYSQVSVGLSPGKSNGASEDFWPRPPTPENNVASTFKRREKHGYNYKPKTASWWGMPKSDKSWANSRLFWVLSRSLGLNRPLWFTWHVHYFQDQLFWSMLNVWPCKWKTPKITSGQLKSKESLDTLWYLSEASGSLQVQGLASAWVLGWACSAYQAWVSWQGLCSFRPPWHPRLHLKPSALHLYRQCRGLMYGSQPG